MHEFTLGGAWFRWRSFDRASRTLAIAAMGSGAVAGLLFGMAAKPVNDRFGFDVTAHISSLALGGIFAAILAACLWRRFSIRQDEMFNHMQNWALGTAGAWTCVVSTFWYALAAGLLAPPMPGAALPLLFGGLMTIFWFVAVHKWAS